MLIFALCGLLSGNVIAQFRYDPVTKPSASGNALIKEFESFEDASTSATATIPGLEGEAKVIQPSHKSGVLAAVLSLALPGLGEYYVGDHIWRGVIFTVIDAGLWYERYHFFARGADSTNAFHAFADNLWSPVIYADSLNSLLNLAHRTFKIDTSSNADLFSQINKAEDSLNILGFQNFTHKLPAQGSQQYYELISKYKQFRSGWKDYIYGGEDYFSPDYEQHAWMRDNMNHQYEIADYFLYGLFLNRILSAIDAVLLAKDHNTPVHLEGELMQHHYLDGTMGFIPTAKLRYTF